jgi:hypothetical protein
MSANDFENSKGTFKTPKAARPQISPIVKASIINSAQGRRRRYRAHAQKLLRFHLDEG